MDRSSELTDAFVEVRFGEMEPQRSEIARKTLNPVWDHDFVFEVNDDAALQNEPLEIHVLDYDAISANDPIGTLLVNIDTLTIDGVSQICGWFPLYDTLRGVRGEIHLTVTLEFFGDINPFKESSAGVRFFASHAVNFDRMCGLVDAIVTEDDPEYHWRDNFKTPRASNEARQRLMFRLSGQLRRILGKKTLDLGGNSVLGTRQTFDFEHRRVVARIHATACFVAAHGAQCTVSPQCTRSTTQFDVCIVTLKSFPPNILQLAGLVSAKSVKLNTPDELEDTRNLWWDEVRNEIKAHARALHCSHVVGYSEYTAVYEDLVILHALGTAACINYESTLACGLVHLPYPKSASPFPMAFADCLTCKAWHVPSVLISTTDPPCGGTGELIAAYFVRQKRRKDSEAHAAAISDVIPFADYDLHNKILAQLRQLKKNAIFGFTLKMSVSEDLISVVASGTAFSLEHLPIPTDNQDFSPYDIEEGDNSVFGGANVVHFLDLAKDEASVYENVYTTAAPTLPVRQKLAIVVTDTRSDQLPDTFKRLYSQMRVQWEGATIAGLSQHVEAVSQSKLQITLCGVLMSETMGLQAPALRLLHDDLDVLFTQDACLLERTQLGMHTTTDYVSNESMLRDIHVAIGESDIPDIECLPEPQIKQQDFVLPEFCITTLSTPGVINLGKLSLHFVKEGGLLVEEQDGMGSFMQLFLAESLSVMRAHVLALGANTIIAFTIEKSMFRESLKGQAYAFISLSGDVCKNV